MAYHQKAESCCRWRSFYHRPCKFCSTSGHRIRPSDVLAVHQWHRWRHRLIHQVICWWLLTLPTISSIEDTTKLQKDLNTLHEWSNRWQMKFNAKKCYTMRIHRGKHPITHNYTMGGEELCAVSSQAYLSVEIHERLSWKPHIEAVVSKAGKTLGFLRRNLGKCHTNIKKQAYISLVRSQLEYASVIWDPQTEPNWSIGKNPEESCTFCMR